MRLPFPLFVGSLLLSSALAAAQGSDEVLARALEAYAAPLERAGLLSGVLLIIHGDEILCERAWGKANYELDVPIGPGTRFCIASVTKPMTIVLTVNSPTTFFSPQDFGTVTVTRDARGTPRGLAWVGPGFSLNWEWVGPLPAAR